jgi:hypothetical protein
MSSVRAILFIYISMVVPIFSFGQQSTKERVLELESRLFSLPDAPYQLNVESFGSGYEFCNNSAKGVVKLRLGCVERKKDGLSIVSERPFVDADIGPADYDTSTCLYWKLDDHLFPGETCSEGKLAIVEVELADKTVWKLKS